METDAACRQCGFSLESVDRLFGIPPMLERPVTDLSRSLRSGERSKISAAVQAMEQHFPQLSFAIVLATLPDGITAETWAFWLFNRGSLFSAVATGGENHGVLLLVNTDDDEALLTIGYGLEPFISEGILEECLLEASPLLEKRHYAAAILACLAKLDTRFTEVCQSLPKVFGLHDEGTWTDSSLDTETTVSRSRRDVELF